MCITIVTKVYSFIALYYLICCGNLWVHNFSSLHYSKTSVTTVTPLLLFKAISKSHFAFQVSLTPQQCPATSNFTVLFSVEGYP